MSERNFELYLTDILESGRAIQSYVQGIEFKGFADDRMRYTAAIREFEIIGEAVGKLPEDIKAKHPNVPWREIKDFRNMLIHEYFGVDRAPQAAGPRAQAPLGYAAQEVPCAKPTRRCCEGQ